MPMYAIWGALIILFGIFEAATAQLVSIWFVFGAIASLVASLLNATVIVQIIVFVVVSVLALIATRPIVKKHLNTKTVRTNADRILGREAIVIEQIDNISSVGQVKVDGNVWSAKSVDNTTIPIDSIVTIEKIEGVKLLVKLK